MSDENARILLEALRQERKLPLEQRWKDMVDRGVIDEKGNVLLPSIAPRDNSLEPEPEPQAAETQ